jgi:hypothetical protein
MTVYRNQRDTAILRSCDKVHQRDTGAAPARHLREVSVLYAGWKSFIMIQQATNIESLDLGRCLVQEVCDVHMKRMKRIGRSWVLYKKMLDLEYMSVTLHVVYIYIYIYIYTHTHTQTHTRTHM